MTEPNQLRVGHTERNNAVAALQRAAAEGKLTAEELQQRTAAAQAARVYADLDVLLADLQPTAGPSAQPVPLPRVEQYPVAPTGPRQLPSGPPGYIPGDPLIINAGFTGAKRTGPWQLPPFVRVQALADTVRLDCLQATTQAEVIDLEVLPGAGTVLLVVPSGWGVRVDRLGKNWGSITTKVPEQPAWGHPLIAVRGSIGLGSFKARGANWFDRRRLGQEQDLR